LVRKTGKLLTASLWPNLRIFAGKILAGLKKILTWGKQNKLKLPRYNTPKPEAGPVVKNSISDNIKKTNKYLSGWIKNLFSQPIAWLGNLLGKTIKIFKLNKAISTTQSPTPKPLKKITTAKKLEVNNGLSKTGRIYLAITSVLVVAFVSSLWLISVNKAKQNLANEANGQIATIQEKINAAEAALIYQDEEKAQKLLIDGQTLLETLSGNAKLAAEQAKKIDLLNQALSNITLKIHHINAENELATVANFSTLPNKNGDFKLAGFSLSGGAMYAVDNQNGLYSIDLKNSSFSPVGNLTGNSTAQGISFLDDKNLITKDTNNKFTNFNLTDKTITQLNTALKEGSNVTGWKIYEGKLYLIDSVGGQIYKFSKQGNDFAPRSAWLKSSSVNLTNSDSIAVDGNIWLNSDHEVIKLFKGAPAEFKISGLEKVLGPKFKLYTDSELDNLYILDQSNFKVIMVDKKTGKVLEQYLYPAQYELSDVAVSQNGKVIYLLGKDKIYKIEVK
jgi:hypothetical protein